MLKNILLEEWNKIPPAFLYRKISVIDEQKIKSLCKCQRMQKQNTKHFLIFHILAFFSQVWLVYENFCDML